MLVLRLIPTLAAASLLAQHTVDTAAAEAMREIQRGDFDSASKLVDRELARHPENADLWNLLGIANTELKRPETAKKAFAHGLMIAPKSLPLNENTGLFYFRQGDYVAAKKYLEYAVELGSTQPGVSFSLAAAELRTGETVKAAAELIALEPALGTSPDYWVERGRAELLTDAVKAEISFNKAADLQPGNINALNGAASAAEEQRLDEKALSYLIRARAAAPGDVPTLAHFGQVCIRRDLGPDAADALSAAHKLQPSNNAVLYLLARANISLQNWQQAYDQFRELTVRVPQCAPAYFAMGWLDLRLGRRDEARRFLEQAITLAPHLTCARLELAQLDLEDGKLDAAQTALARILTEQPSDAKANMAMGDVLTRRGNLPRAQSYFETATRLDPKLAAAHYKLSLLYFRQHDIAHADREKQIAADLNAEATRLGKTQFRLVLPENWKSSLK